MSRLELLHQYAEQEPDNPFNWYALATEYRKYSLVEALPYYEKVWQEFPDYAPNYYHLAHAYWELQEIEKARQVFEQGLQVLSTQKETKMLQELQNAYHNFLLENDLLE
ncbi:MAG: tetratricopeptide repeat protein [Raineya sp.]|nr:tetratricopeptide repeat protein [Raineya sp.]MDW8296156.1 tetratricopeptide repeat protein [Raineya sp.]